MLVTEIICLQSFNSVKCPYNHWFGTQLLNPDSEIKITLKHLYESPHTDKPSKNEMFSNYAMWGFVVCAYEFCATQSSVNNLLSHSEICLVMMFMHGWRCIGRMWEKYLF